MEWMLIVLVLAFVWWFLRQRTPRDPAPKALPDARELFAERFEAAADEARRDGRDEEAQEVELRAAWLRTKPRFGDETPPEQLDPNEMQHLRFVDDVWERYGRVLAEQGAPHAACRFRPAATLPFPKDAIGRALDMLLDIGEGRVASLARCRPTLSRRSRRREDASTTS
jgi:hypothetical protein